MLKNPRAIALVSSIPMLKVVFGTIARNSDQAREMFQPFVGLDKFAQMVGESSKQFFSNRFLLVEMTKG